MKRKLFVTFIISFCLLLTACGNSNKQQAENNKQQEEIELTPENAIEYFRVDKSYSIEEPRNGMYAKTYATMTIDIKPIQEGVYKDVTMLLTIGNGLTEDWELVDDDDSIASTTADDLKGIYWVKINLPNDGNFSKTYKFTVSSVGVNFGMVKIPENETMTAEKWEYFNTFDENMAKWYGDIAEIGTPTLQGTFKPVNN